MDLKKSFFTVSAILGMMLLGIISCQKNDAIISPPSAAEFAIQNNTMLGTYYIKNDPNSVYKLPIGITTVSDKDRVVQFTYVSSTGAAQGTQYSAPSSITIPAGKTLDSLSIKGLFGGYTSTSGRKDTLRISISGGDAPANAYNNTYTLIMLKYCDVIGANLVGDYTQSTDIYNGGASTKPKYTANLSNFTPVSATSATVTLKNIGATSDNGWGPFSATDPVITPGLTATLDWSNPANFTVTIPTQNYFNDGTGMSTIKATGTFSSCDNTFSIVCTVKYAGNGNSYVHTSSLKR